MKQITVSELFGGYHYGPADLEGIELGDGYVRLLLRDAAGRELSAVYRGCAHWPITPSAVGKHFSIVREVKSAELAAPEYALVLSDLQKGGGSPLELLQKWEAEGYRFYLHLTDEKDVDYLVVARELTHQYETRGGKQR